MKETNPLDALKKFRGRYKTQRDAATALGVSGVYLSDLLNARRDFSDKMLAKLGLKRAVVKS